MAAPAEQLDDRFVLANERTFLAWVRTALGFMAAGIVAAKALNFEHEWLRWLVAVPPIVAGALVAGDAYARWRTYDAAMRAGRPLPAGRGLALLAIGMVVYAVVVLTALLIDG